jgi:hypothetical protein
MDRKMLPVYPVGVSTQVWRQIGKNRVKDRKERTKGVFVAGVGSRRNQHEVAICIFGQFPQQQMPLMLGAADSPGKGAGVSLVHNDKFRTSAKKVIPAMVRLDVVQGDDREGEMIEEALATSAIGFQTTSRTRQDQLGIDLELVLQLSLPLFSEVRWAEDGHACNFAAVQQFLGEESRFNGFSDTHVICNEEAHRVLLEAHEQWN